MRARLSLSTIRRVPLNRTPLRDFINKGRFMDTGLIEPNEKKDRDLKMDRVIIFEILYVNYANVPEIRHCHVPLSQSLISVFIH